MLTDSQVRALSDAEANGGKGQPGLTKCQGRWFIESRLGVQRGHSGTTINSLVARGLMQLYVRGTVAHITDLGREVLEDWRTARKPRRV